MKKNRKLTGTVHHVDLEGGYYTLRTRSGDVFKLDGGDAGLRTPGATVEIEGDVEDKGFGISFGTPILKVQSYKVVDGKDKAGG
ncbi:MAG: DUF5818 domain-containing protein [Polyangia bacterium]